jgi:1-acyl-sn-glycerol-3-phosphate acyltransferase
LKRANEGAINQSNEIHASRIKIILCAIALGIWIAIGAITMLVAKLVRWRGLQTTFPLWFHRLACKLFTLDVEVSGNISGEIPTLYVANHASYLDVFVLGGLLKGAFVAKSEVASWPLFGKLAQLQNTLFLERRARRAREQIAVVSNYLRNRGSLIMFPEGTSTSGDYVAPFRSTLLAAADDLNIQPITVAYTHYDGELMQRHEREHYAWYLPNPNALPPTPNAPFLAHFIAALGLQRCTVTVIFHDPIRTHADADRKIISKQCEDLVRSGLEEALNGTNAGNDPAIASRA